MKTPSVLHLPANLHILCRGPGWTCPSPPGEVCLHCKLLTSAWWWSWLWYLCPPMPPHVPDLCWANYSDSFDVAFPHVPPPTMTAVTLSPRRWHLDAPVTPAPAQYHSSAVFVSNCAFVSNSGLSGGSHWREAEVETWRKTAKSQGFSRETACLKITTSDYKSYTCSLSKCWKIQSLKKGRSYRNHNPANVRWIGSREISGCQGWRYLSLSTEVFSRSRVLSYSILMGDF